MSKTLKVSDGDIFINNNGQSELVEGNRKAGQDTAGVLLTDYNSETNFGSELTTFQTSLGFVMTGAAQQLISEAVNRLRAKQREDDASTPSERITGIKRLDIQSMDNGDIVFFLELNTESGEVIDRALLIPTSLNQLIPNGAI